MKNKIQTFLILCLLASLQLCASTAKAYNKADFHPAPNSDQLTNGQSLKPGQRLLSANREFEAAMDEYGNLAINLLPEKVRIWSPPTTNYGNRWELELGATGMLRLVNPQNKNINQVLCNGGGFVAKYTLRMQNDGNLVLYSSMLNKALWSSGSVTNPTYFRKALRIVKISCHKTTENYDTDEIFFTSSDKNMRKEPLEISSNQSIYLNYNIPLDNNGMCNFEVREHDNTDSDQIGTMLYSFNPNSIAESFQNTEIKSKRLTGDGGNYTVHYRLVHNRFTETFPINEINPSFMPGGDFSRKDKPEAWLKDYASDWMSKLDSTTRLGDLSIPGTHNSGSRRGGDAAECQSWTVRDQLEAGIRYLDIRVRPTGGKFAIHHGKVYQGLMFGDILNQIMGFLSNHEGETVIMTIKEDHVGPNSFTDVWKYYINHPWYKDLFITCNPTTGKYPFADSSNPTLEEVRGKILVLMNMTVDNSDLRGIHFSPKVEVHNNFRIQNDWDVQFVFEGHETKGISLPGKKKKAINYVERADNEYKAYWVINFICGSTGMMPYDVADHLNTHVYKHLMTLDMKKHILGTIVMDFPGEHLIYRIIQSNFDLE